MIADAKKPVVAAVERLVLGGGLELALVCVVHNIYVFVDFGSALISGSIFICG